MLGALQTPILDTFYEIFRVIKELGPPNVGAIKQYGENKGI